MDISYIWSFLVAKEGGYVNSSSDRGGKTKYGISELAFPYVNIEHLTEDQAENIFEEDYFSYIKGNDLLKLAPSLALQMSDMAYNCGTRMAVKCLQRTLNDIDDDVYLLEDGHMTEAVLRRLKDVIAKYGMNHVAILFTCFRIRYYASLPRHQWETYGYGWTERSFETLNSSHIVISEPIRDLIKSILNCLKPLNTRFEMKENVLHYINRVIQIVKTPPEKSESVIQS
jgi:lysozyme family protein